MLQLRSLVPSILTGITGIVAAPGVSGAGLLITEVMPQTSVGTASTVNGDWWELTNSGPTAVNLSGYHWADTEDQLAGPTPQPNFFPALVLGVGQSVIVLEELSGDVPAWRANWGGLAAATPVLGTDVMLPAPVSTDTFSGLGNSNDGVFVYNAVGTLLDSFLYATNTRGRSFESSDIDLGLSVAGENFAFAATNGDVGSPGAALVPEPTAVVALLGFVAGTQLRRARRRALVQCV